MSDTQRDQLEMELAKMTTYTGAETALWRSAIERSKKAPAQRSVLHAFNWRTPWALAAMVVIIGGLATIALVTGPTGRARDQALYSYGVDAPQRVSSDLSAPASPPPSRPARLSAAEVHPHRATASDPDRADTEPLSQRMVIRRATIDLAAEDVRGTYLRIMQIPSVARGEYIDDSSLTGNEPEKLHGSITLRVSAERLADVLNELRGLGRVVSEQSKADDVTGQVVDLEARLRNERRIEQELLELLSTREDAPLKDVLELRRHLEQVRGQIERLTAQRDRLDRLVSLATVLVIIRPDQLALEPEEDQPGLGAYFLENLSSSAVAGLRVLADTIAGFVHLLIGGLVWWMIAFVCIMIARAMWLRSAALPT